MLDAQERDHQITFPTPMSRLDQPIAATSHARRLVDVARSVLVLTGAGISQPSGVPTFRGPGGLWRDHKPEELATPAAFARDPVLVWEWYAWRRSLVAECDPNPAHHALARFTALHPGVTLVTQNVDGLHERAAAELALSLGITAAQRARPLALHGSLNRVRCTSCSYGADYPELVDATSLATLPTCPDCNMLLRPDIVWFGEALPTGILERAWTAAESADICLVLGTSAVVQPAASLASATHASGGQVIEVNPQSTPLSAIASVVLRDSVELVVPAILATWQSADSTSEPVTGTPSTSRAPGPDASGADADGQ